MRAVLTKLVHTRRSGWPRSFPTPCGWDARTVSDKVERAIGRTWYIRINVRSSADSSGAPHAASQVFSAERLHLTEIKVSADQRVGSGIAYWSGDDQVYGEITAQINRGILKLREALASAHGSAPWRRVR
jgi:hypothetical protein